MWRCSAIIRGDNIPVYFYSDESAPPDEYFEFVKEHKEEICDKYVDHFPYGLKDYFSKHMRKEAKYET